jgi:hypothetical protein
MRRRWVLFVAVGVAAAAVAGYLIATLWLGGADDRPSLLFFRSDS